MNGRILFIISLICIQCTDNEYEIKIKEKHTRPTSCYTYIQEIDLQEIRKNFFLHTDLKKIKSEKFISLKSVDSLPKNIKKQLSIITPDKYNSVDLNKELRLSDYCPDNPNNLPCRKIKYLGISKRYVIISYLQVCKGCHNYAYNVLIIKYNSFKILDIWVGNFHPYIIKKITTNTHKFNNINLADSDSIINYIEDKLKNAPDKLHILNEIVI